MKTILKRLIYDVKLIKESLSTTTQWILDQLSELSFVTFENNHLKIITSSIILNFPYLAFKLNKLFT